MKFLSNYIQTSLNITNSQLPSLLGISEQELSEWENYDLPNSAPKKAMRLVLLADIVEFVTENYPELQQTGIVNILKQDKIVFDTESEFPFLGFVVSSGTFATWRLVLSQLLDERINK